LGKRRCWRNGPAGVVQRIYLQCTTRALIAKFYHALAQIPRRDSKYPIGTRPFQLWSESQIRPDLGCDPPRTPKAAARRTHTER